MFVQRFCAFFLLQRNTGKNSPPTQITYIYIYMRRVEIEAYSLLFTFTLEATFGLAYCFCHHHSSCPFTISANNPHPEPPQRTSPSIQQPKSKKKMYKEPIRYKHSKFFSLLIFFLRIEITIAFLTLP